MKILIGKEVKYLIEINLYNNGYEIIGHANQVTCSEVSILSWAIGNTLAKIDFNRYWHDEHGYTMWNIAPTL
jgi:hypothetical protein